MKAADAEEYTQALGQIVAGSWRQIALAKRLGVPRALGLSVDDRVNQRLGGYVKMSIAERREAAKELNAEGMSQREIGQVLGVGVATVNRDVSNGTDTVDKATAADDPTVPVVPDGTPINAVAALAADDRIRAAVARSDVAYFSSETNEWYTPPQYLESVRAVFGADIDLDPASCENANATVRANHYFTEADDGLARDWFGRVFLNPPYGVADDRESRAGVFCRKAIAEYQAGRVTEAIILVNSVHAQRWQAPLYRFAVCFVDHRIRFVAEHGELSPNPTFGNIFVYLGKHRRKFAEVFSKHGHVMELVLEPQGDALTEATA